MLDLLLHRVSQHNYAIFERLGLNELHVIPVLKHAHSLVPGSGADSEVYFINHAPL